MKARMGKEIYVETPDEVGALAKVLNAILQTGVSMEAMTAYGQSGRGHFIMVTSDNVKAARVLENMNYTVSENNVVIAEFEDKKGMGASVAEKLADARVNINYTYSGARGNNVIFVASTMDNYRALEVLAELEKTSSRTSSKRPSSSSKRTAKGSKGKSKASTKTKKSKSNKKTKRRR